MEVRSEWARCCCCKLSVSQTSGRLKWCADSGSDQEPGGRGGGGGPRRWRLMLALAVVLLPVAAVVSLSVVKFTAAPPHRPTQTPHDPHDLFKSVVALDTDMSEGSRPNLIQDYHTTSCFPTTKGFYTIRNKRAFFMEPHQENDTSRRTEVILWARHFQSPKEFEWEDIVGGGDILNDTSASLDEFGRKNVEIAVDIGAPILRSEASRSEEEDKRHRSKSDEAINVLYEEEGAEDHLSSGSDERREFPWDKSEHQQEDKVERDTISERIVPDYPLPSAQQQSFWKGQGDKGTIREAQAKLMRQYMDTNSDPCQDFYQYACGNWGKLNPIPKDKTTFDTFEMLRESLDIVLKELLEERVTNQDIEAYIKAKNLYKSCINYEILEQRGDKPLLDLLERLGQWPVLCSNWDASRFDWLELMARLRLYNNDILISEWVGPDIKNSDEYVIQFDQTSLGLPTRDYYLQPSNTVYLEAYKNYMIKISTLLGADPRSARKSAEEIVAFETSLAKITSASDERRNVSGLYQRMSVGELRAHVPQVDWQRYLTIVLNRTCNNSEPVVIFALRYVQDLVTLLGKTPQRTVANYLLWRFVRHRVNNLDDRYQEAKQHFYYVLVGREKAPPRWKYCVTQVNSNMGMAVGAMFVRKHFDENSKNDTLVMTKEIQQSFNEILKGTTWIAEDTKRLASEKVDTMMLKVGYPDFILCPAQLNDRYRDVVIHPEQYFENTLNILKHLTRVEQAHLGSPVNKSIWNTAPAVVNAYYSRNKNQIMFPAGILQPPFYHRYFPKCLNYGGIGVVIGHEITHGFDDKGRLFDKHGNLHRWWKDEDINNFHERAQCLIEQYSKYVVQEVGIPLDGINTQGENIADNGGIKQAYRAYSRWINTHDGVRADETLPGLNATGQQLFFLNFAQVWCGNTRPEASKNGLKTAVHSPGKFRVIGTLSNSEDFSRVFECPLGSPMNPVKKCSVW